MKNQSQIEERRLFWNNRFQQHSHTGIKNELLYRYDQPLRIKAILSALQTAEIPLHKKTAILDIGCGTGDLVYEFAKRGAQVTGIDISDALIDQTKLRFANMSNVKLYASGIEHFKMPDESFDLITSITVLQHITDQGLFLEALNKLVASTKRDGHLLLFESASEKKETVFSHHTPYSYIVTRTRNEWLAALRNSGCQLLKETSYPQAAVSALSFFKKAASHLFNTNYEDLIVTANDDRGDQTRRSVYFNRLLKLTLLSFRPIDYWLGLPFPLKYSMHRIFIFKKPR